MLFAVAVMLNQNLTAYLAGLGLLMTPMFFDLVDGWFAARHRPQAKLAHLADRIMDKAVYSMIFPLVAVGMMWRYQHLPEGSNINLEMLHVVLVLILCVTVLMRDNFAHFMRNFSLRRGEEEEFKEVTRLRTIISAPVGFLLYQYAFYLPVVGESGFSSWISWFGEMKPRNLIMIEILFLLQLGGKRHTGKAENQQVQK
jgi:phosphatidylglycerophosphate synthase